MWQISKIWNESIDQGVEKPLVARERLWASELGKSDLDIYLKLLAEPVTNPFDARSKRKFEAGNLFEWIVKLILIRCGVYNESQKWVDNNEFGLQVTGKIDHLVGGIPKYDQAKKDIEALMLPDSFTKASESILNYFQANYPSGLPQQGIEVKSTSSFGIEKVYFTGKALAGHDLQAFHYAYNTKLPFTVLYICRDDLRMAEIPILPDNQELLEKYSNKIKGITKLYRDKTEPEKEPEIVYNSEEEKFSKNFNVEYSSYLKRNYGYEQPADYDEKISPIVMSWNRVLERIKSGKDMTDNNKEKLEEMVKFGFDPKIIKVKQDANLKTTTTEGGNTPETSSGTEIA